MNDKLSKIGYSKTLVIVLVGILFYALLADWDHFKAGLFGI